MGRRLWWFGIVMGALLVAFGVAETVRVLTSGDGGLAFWFGSLVGGGACVLAGTLLAQRHRRPSLWLTVVGCVAGALATAWTLVVPFLLLTLVALRLSAERPPAILRPGGKG